MAKAATRDGYGNGLVKIGSNRDVVVLDAGVSDSTRTNKFQEKYPERFFNMGISEQDMVGTAAGLAKCGKIAFATSFAEFLMGPDPGPSTCFSRLFRKQREADGNPRRACSWRGRTDCAGAE